MKRILFLSLLLGSFNVAEGRIVLPPIFGNHMVLQQRSDVLLWGEATPGRRVVIRPSWGGHPVATRAGKDGRWSASVATPEAGGPHTMTISDGKPLVLHDVLIGEVWFCSGQSNMEMPMAGKANQPVAEAADCIAQADPALPIRMFTVDQAGSRAPQQSCNGRWLRNDPVSVASTSAVGWFFANYLHRALGVPVGIIVSSWGGTAIEAWMNRETLAGFPEVDLSFLDDNTPVEKPKYRPTMLYNAMLAPLRGYAIRGFLWYQGESNRHEPALYRRLLPAFVQMLRREWGRGELPFYYVQIAPFAYEDATLAGTALVREAQLQALDDIPSSGMVVTMDLGDEGCIHPVRKRPVGERLARLALAKSYGIQGFDPVSPRLRSMETADGRALLSFECGPEGLAPLGVRFEGFEVAGADRRFYPAEAWIEKGTGRLIVTAPQVPEPVAVRYCFRNYAVGTLYNRFGVPVSSFRTDDWPVK